MPFSYADKAVLSSAVVISLACLAFLSQFLYLAPELSDAAYYVLNNRSPEQISNQISMFGIVWHSLVGELPITASRLLQCALLFGTGFALTWSYTNVAPTAQRIAFSLLTGCAFLTSLLWVLIEPNYNTLALIWLSLSLICALPFLAPVQMQRAQPHARFAMMALGFGAALMVLALTKITSAAAAGLFYVLLYGALHLRSKHGWLTFAKLLAYAVVGFAIVLAFLTLRGASPVDLWSRLNTGRETIALLESHGLTISSLVTKFIAYQSFLADAALAHWGVIALLAVLSTCPLLETRWPAYKVQLWGVTLFIGIAGAVLLLKQAASSSQIELFQTLAVLRICALLAGLYLLWKMRARDRVALGVFIGAALGPFILSVGTTNAWGAQFTLYCGLSFSALCICSARSPIAQPGFGLTPLILCCATLFIGTAGLSMQNHPYRQGAVQSDANISILYGPNGEALRTTPALAKAYLPLEDTRAALAAQSTRPLLIDVTGRAPGVSAYLGTRLPGTAWILSGYPGSDAYFAHVLDQLTDAELEQAWILYPVLSASKVPTLSTQVLETRLARANLTLDTYDSIVEIYIAYVDVTAALLRPKAP